MAQLLDFEDFSSALSVKNPVKLTYEDGYTTGFEAGREQSLREQSVLSSECVQTLADMSFTYAEARRRLLDELRPLFDAISDQVLPELTDTSLTAHIASLLMAHAERMLSEPISLMVSPEDAKGISALLATHPNLALTLVPSQNMEPGQALINRGNTEEMIDVREAVDGIKQILGALFNDAERNAQNG